MRQQENLGLWPLVSVCGPTEAWYRGKPGMKRAPLTSFIPSLSSLPLFLLPPLSLPTCLTLDPLFLLYTNTVPPLLCILFIRHFRSSERWNCLQMLWGWRQAHHQTSTELPPPLNGHSRCSASEKPPQGLNKVSPKSLALPELSVISCFLFSLFPVAPKVFLHRSQPWLRLPVIYWW